MNLHTLAQLHAPIHRTHSYTRTLARVHEYIHLHTFMHTETNTQRHAYIHIYLFSHVLILWLIKGKESIERVLEQLEAEGCGVNENYESFSHVSIRCLGRLLPDARWVSYSELSVSSFY